MSFSFGIAESLYEQHVHPRLLCDGEDIERLRQQVREGPGLRIMEALREKVSATVDAALKVDDPVALVAPGSWRKLGTFAREFITDIALVAVLDDDPRALEAARRVLAGVPEASRRETHDRSNLGYSHCGTLALAYDLLFDRLPADEREDFARWAAQISVRDVLHTLGSKHYLRHPGMNIPLVGMITALMTLLGIEGDPGVPDLSAEKAELLRFLEAGLYTTFGPSGYPVEDIGYGTGMACFLAPPVETVRRAGLYDAYTRCPRWARFGRAMLHFTQPWGKVTSNTGDYGADFGPTGMLLPRLAMEARDPAILWLHGTLSYPIACAGPMDLSQRRVFYPELTLAEGFRVPVDAYSILTLEDLLTTAPQHPAQVGGPTQFMDPDRGIASFRSGWDADATFVVFDGARRTPAAQGHAHDSGGHFSLSALGEYFAIDTGRYNIEQEHHNVVIVDGRSGHVGDGSWVATYYQAELTGYWPGDFVDAASVNYSQMSDCYWARRTLGLVKGAGAPAYVFTVEDVNKAHDYHEFWWLLNVHPDSRIELNGDWATVVGAYHGNLLDVHFALPAPDEYPKPHTLTLEQHLQLAGSPKEYGGDPHKSAQEYRRLVGLLEYGPVFERPRLDAKVAGYNGRFMALLLPRCKDTPPAKVERLPTMDNVLAVRISFPQVEDTIIWAYEHHLLEAGDVKARGNWCVVRRNRVTGEVLRYALHDGARLEVAGKHLADELVEPGVACDRKMADSAPPHLSC